MALFRRRPLAVAWPAARSSARRANWFRIRPRYLSIWTWRDLYSRLDATVRPILQVGAAFVPGLSQRLDPSKLPPTEVVTKHLSPVVASTSYVNGGYRSESAGTITIEQAAIAGGAAYVGAMILQQHQVKGGSSPALPIPAAPPSPSPGAVGPSPTP
jgi:hypothetical protein